MTAAATLVPPGSRVLHAWWRELAGVRPSRLWFAHLLLHRVEVLVEVSITLPLANLAQALLHLLVGRPSTFRTGQLAGELHLSRELLEELLGDLAQRGLVRPAREGSPDAWEVTPQTAAIDHGPATRKERRTFFFTDGPEPLYLPIDPSATVALSPPEGWRFDLSVLDGCLRQTPEWKARHGFPQDVLRRIELPANPGEEDWRSVALERAAQSILLLTESEESGAVLGFPVRLDGWRLTPEPVLSLPYGREALGPILEEVGPDSWKQAWQAWCQQRGVAPGEVESCRLEWADHRLQVHAPARLIERLRAARSDALKGEAWLLVGTGRVRAAALIELVEPARSGPGGEAG